MLCEIREIMVGNARNAPPFCRFRTIFSPETNSETMKTISYFGITRYYFGISTTYFAVSTTDFDIFRSNNTELHHENATSHHIFAEIWPKTAVSCFQITATAYVFAANNIATAANKPCKRLKNKRNRAIWVWKRHIRVGERSICVLICRNFGLKMMEWCSEVGEWCVKMMEWYVEVSKL